MAVGESGRHRNFTLRNGAFWVSLLYPNGASIRKKKNFFFFFFWFARGSPVVFSQSYVEYDLRKNKTVVPFFANRLIFMG
jgi:hypothetical protein